MNISISDILPRRNIFDEYIKQYQTVFKLHGDVHYYLSNIEEEDIIFNKRQYIDSIKTNAKMLSKLQDDFADGNLLYLGCSLTDEPDLVSIVVDAVKMRRAKCQTFYLTNSILDEDKKDLLEDYGITSCIIISDYNKFYRELVTAVNSKEIHQAIDIYEEPEVIELDKENTTIDCILNSNALIPVPFNGKIYKPPFFIKRTCASDIILKLTKENPVHIICGHRISGKTFCLIDLYESIKDKTRYFFPSGTKISDTEIEQLLNKHNCAFIYDTNSLDAEQIYRLTNIKKRIGDNDNYLLIAVNSSDRNGLDLITANKFYGFSHIKNSFENKEIDELNTKLQLLNQPTFINRERILLGYKRKYCIFPRTIMDNLCIISDKFTNGTYTYELSDFSKYDSTELLALLILIATQQSLSTYDLNYFGLRKEAYEFANKLPIHFAINYYQYNISNFDSHYKLSCNSRYFLLKYLGEYAKQEKNYQNILLVYKYLYTRISNAESEFDTPRVMMSPYSPENDMDVYKLSAQLTIINRDNIHYIGELEGKIEWLKAEFDKKVRACNEASTKLTQLETVISQAEEYFELKGKSELSASEKVKLQIYLQTMEHCKIQNRTDIESVREMCKNISERSAALNTELEKCREKYNTYSDIVKTYRELSSGDYISRLVKEEEKRRENEQRKKTQRR